MIPLLRQEKGGCIQTTKDITDGIANALKSAFGDSYGIYDSEQGQDMEKPCFFISPIKQTIRQFPGKRYKRENRFSIRYYPGSENDTGSECRSVSENMLWCLEKIKIQGIPVLSSNVSFEVAEGILNFFVDYNFFVWNIDVEEKMDGVCLDTKVKG